MQTVLNLPPPPRVTDKTLLVRDEEGCWRELVVTRRKEVCAGEEKEAVGVVEEVKANNAVAKCVLVTL